MEIKDFRRGELKKQESTDFIIKAPDKSVGGTFPGTNPLASGKKEDLQ